MVKQKFPDDEVLQPMQNEKGNSSGCIVNKTPHSCAAEQVYKSATQLLLNRINVAGLIKIHYCILKFFFIAILIVQSIAVAAQTKPAGKYTLNGYIRDSLSGETIIGATISVNGESKGASSNQYGFYSITLDEGSYEISVSHISYQTQAIQVNLQDNVQFNFELLSRSAAIDEVVVYSKRRDANIRNAQMGRIDLSISQIKNIPAFMGEIDILKAIQLLPGVRNAGEGNAGFFVRGGGADQNLIMLDDAVVYNSGHLFGFFSIFNSDAIKNTSLIKGGMPAQYGGRLSSVLDVAMKDGNMNEMQAEGGIGLIASRFSIQGPLKKIRLHLLFLPAVLILMCW